MTWVLSIMMLATLALAGGGFVLWRRGVRKQAGLMLLLAVIAALNVAIWTVPDKSGASPSQRLDTAAKR